MLNINAVPTSDVGHRERGLGVGLALEKFGNPSVAVEWVIASHENNLAAGTLKVA